jgi:hypothetical protein
VNTNTEYLAVFSKTNSISGTGASIITAISSYSPDRKNLSSYDSSLV